MYPYLLCACFVVFTKQICPVVIDSLQNQQGKEKPILKQMEDH